MDFTLNEEQALLRESAERFLRDKHDFACRASLLAGGAGKVGLWPEIVSLGWPALGLPEALGGMDGTVVEQAILMQELGRALYVGPYMSTAITCAALLREFGSQTSGELLADIGTGKCLLAWAHGEPEGRGICDLPRTEAVADGDGHVRLTGRKRLVHDLKFATGVILTATGEEGAVICLLDPAAPGVARRDYRALDKGFASDLELEGARAEVLAVGTTADRALDEAIYVTLTALGAEAIGVAEGALNETMAYVAGRKQFGTLLTDFQVVQHQISDLFVEIEQLKALLLHALSCAEAGSNERRRAAIGLKILSGRVATEVAGKGLHLHGGMGMTEEMPISHYYRRARVLEAQYGNSDYFTRLHAAGLN